ncbi:MAG: hypothetical protein VKL42_02610 [Snowella sp.]|nr:hypothetical protein [Snowella sp.]
MNSHSPEFAIFLSYRDRCCMKKEVNRLPITQQALRCFQLCQNLTNLYFSVDLVRLDRRTGNVIIL